MAQRVSIAAAVSAVIGGAYLFASAPTNYSTDFHHRNVVQCGPNKITLNTASDMQLICNRNILVATMMRGEAIFDIVHDDSRVVIVKTLDVTIRDVGTHFGVRIQPDKTSVTVLEGEVALTSPSPAYSFPGDASLSAGHRITLRRNGSSISADDSSVSEAEILRSWEWRRGRVAFQDAPLEEVVREANRYRDSPIVISDPTLASQRVTVEPIRPEYLVSALDALKVDGDRIQADLHDEAGPPGHWELKRQKLGK